MIRLSTSSVEESVQIIKSEVVPCLQNAMENLQNIWTEIGFPEDQKQERTRTVLFHLRKLLQEMVEEEDELKSILQANVQTCSKELEKLSQELGLPVYKFEEKMSILMLENELRKRVDALKLEKHERFRNLKTLREKESKFCERLNLPAHNLGDVTVPSKEQLKELEANVDYLKKEMTKRLDAFKELKQSIQMLWVVLERTPSATLEFELAQEDAETTFKLSSQNMEGLKDLHFQLEQEQERNFSEAFELSATINSLWTKLEVEKSERSGFLNKHVGCKPSVIAGLRGEVHRLQELKLKHTKKFIDSLRKELMVLWDKCYFGPTQREEFAPAFDENYTEELMTLHEHQVEVMKKFYEDNKAIFKLVEKREALFKTMEEFENMKNDANRLANRGGALLKEEKLRKGINNELPKLEQKLKAEVEKWEGENERRFLINGCHYLDIINHQWAALSAQKEQEKMNRHKRQQEIMEKEIVFGSKPATTHKRRPLGGTLLKTPIRLKTQDGTTVSTPSKFSSHSVCPTHRPPPYGRPPVATKSKKITKLSKTTNPRTLSARIAGKQQIVGNKYINSSKVINSCNSSNNNDISLVACTSYNEFATGLEQVENNNCQSSLLNTPNSVMSLL